MTLALTNVSAVKLGAVQGGAQPADLKKVADEFESVFLAQMLRTMSEGQTGSGPMPLANADSNPFASMLQDEYAALIGKSGGIGISGAVMRELLTAQEAAA